MEPQKTLNSQRNSEKKRTKLVVSHSLTANYTIIQSNNNQNGMVLAEKQKTHGPMVWSENPELNPIYMGK